MIINKNITLSQFYNNFCNKKFPVMIKIIDAKQPLSVQVHPDNDYAAKIEHDSGKTEMWQIIAHEPDAFLYLGFNDNYSKHDVEKAIKDGALINMLKKIKVHDGERFFIHAGTVHAIGGGILLAETQQNSNITYRVYDYNRLGADGKPRELHVKKALDVMNLSPADYSVPNDAPFQSEIIDINDINNINNDINHEIKIKKINYKFLSVILISGAGRLIYQDAEIKKIKEIKLEKYKAVLVPPTEIKGADINGVKINGGDFIFKPEKNSKILLTAFE